jgi:dipeptidyl aminopeptidase/acylaminoacyl peptidase
VFCAAGFVVVAPNYRGFGASEGERGWVIPEIQLQDLVNTITYCETVPDLDHKRLGVYGHGGTGGGNAVILTAVDPRVKCVAVQSPVSDGPTWLRSMGRNYEWLEYLERVETNARTRVLTGKGEIIDPREDIMVATPARKAATFKSGVDKAVGSEFHLASVEHLMRYRPIDYVARIAPRPFLVIALTRDVVTPEDLGAERLFAAAGTPKIMFKQNEAVTHYESYSKNLDLVGPVLTDFYTKHLVSSRVTLTTETAGSSVVERLG